MLLNYLETDFSFSDERGCLTQLVREGYSQVNYVETKAGVVRGGHYHKINKEAFYLISGEIEVKLASLDGVMEHYTFKSGDMFSIEPNVIHTFSYKEDTKMICMYDKGVEIDKDNKDIYEP